MAGVPLPSKCAGPESYAPAGVNDRVGAPPAILPNAAAVSAETVPGPATEEGADNVPAADGTPPAVESPGVPSTLWLMELRAFLALPSNSSMRFLSAMMLFLKGTM